MTKLLSKPFKAFTVYSMLILMCSIPVYFFVVESIWIEELDEHNLIVKERIEKQFSQLELTNDSLDKIIQLWNIFQPGTTINSVELNHVKKDSTYTTLTPKKFTSTKEIDRFRVLDSYIKLQGKNYHLSIETNVEEVDETLIAIAIVTFAFFGILIFGFILLNKNISKKIWKPFNSTLETLKTFDINKNQQIQFETSDIQEFQELNEELKKLIERSTRTYNLQKSFIENASHELQTPLAVLKSKIELLGQSEEINESISNKIVAINNPLSRIIRINKNLLLLAKIENKQFTNNEYINLNKAIDENIELLSDYIDAKEISLNIETKGKIYITCNKILVEILLNNLMINAINNTDKGQQIRIAIDDNQLSISNTGKQALIDENLYQRFVKVGNDSVNTGLGLSIIKEICNRYNWTINYYFKDLTHNFIIDF